MRRTFLTSVLLAVCAVGTGCSRYFIQKDAYTAVKRAALVQYAVNPHLLLGTAAVDDVRRGAAQANVATFLKEMNGNPYELMSLDEMKSKPGYASGKEAVEGYFTAPGMRFFADERDNDAAQLKPEVVTKLCEDLGVDAVIAIADSWSVKPGFGGFTSAVYNSYTFNMYDKTGKRIWGDQVTGTSTDSVGSPGGILAGSQEELIKLNNQAFTAALGEAKQHLAK